MANKKILEVKPIEEMIKDFQHKCEQAQQGLQKAAKKREANPDWRRYFGSKSE